MTDTVRAVLVLDWRGKRPALSEPSQGGVVALSQSRKGALEAVSPAEAVAVDWPQDRELDAGLSNGTDGVGIACAFDRDDLLARLGGAEEAVDRIISLFVVSVSGHLVALAQAVSEADAREVLFHAHTIVGIAANVGAPNIRRIARRIEALAKAGSLAEVPGLLAELQESLQAFQSLFDAEAKDKAKDKA